MKIFIVGSGNVAFAMGKAFRKAGHNIRGVYGRNQANTVKLAKALSCKTYLQLQDLPLNGDLYLIAVKDDAISEISKKLPALKGLVVHTSGTVPLSVLSKFKKHGVFYPVETITATGKTSFRRVPICLEASGENEMKSLMKLANTISQKIYVLNSNQRMALHIAAVFTNNFSNYLLTIASSILNKEHLSVELLENLANSTIKNAFIKGPLSAQTGPARRNDTTTINNHLRYLRFNKNYKEAYQLMTRQIMDVHNKLKK